MPLARRTRRVRWAKGQKRMLYSRISPSGTAPGAVLPEEERRKAAPPSHHPSVPLRCSQPQPPSPPLTLAQAPRMLARHAERLTEYQALPPGAVPASGRCLRPLFIATERCFVTSGRQSPVEMGNRREMRRWEGRGCCRQPSRPPPPPSPLQGPPAAALPFAPNPRPPGK